MGNNAETEGFGELNISDRRARIVQMVNRDGKVRVVELSRLFEISEVTIRNDLSELENMDLLERTHGGAVRTNKSYYRLTVQERMAANKNEKVAIAARAVAMINEGDTVFLNSGTTSVYIAQAARGIKNLLVITNSPLVAQELGYSNECEAVLVGGSYDGRMAFTYGDDAVMQISRYRAGKFFFSCDGISASSGLMIYSTHEVEVNSKFMENSATVIAVADYSKVGRTSRISVGGIASLDVLVTNACSDADELRAIREAGVEIFTV